MSKVYTLGKNPEDRVLVFGDIHGEVREVSSIYNTFSEMVESNIKDIIFVGDIGMGFFKGDVLEKTLADFFPNVGVWLIRGNHDNPSFWTEEHAKEIEEKYPNIHFVLDDSILMIHNKAYLVMGGGVSIDQAYRTEGVSYWKDELVKEPGEHDVDIYGIISHSGPCPPYITKNAHPLIKYGSEKMKADLEAEAELFDRTLTKYNPKVWIYGHYHSHNFYEYKGCHFCNLDINEPYLIDNQDV